ncbi:MAG TPA: iron-containing alcohol dehydrogenase [Candidatus Sumerlaeota bacterium]|nr:MAG: 1,3-propanediol dehydrogenase [candidate division BRC1 bacterium ADurb.Bin183]HOE62559.1 iron-containing alcohol dehydrogenase [Candidatus Sumerlaeota bacterium]HRR30847.1 iron-containing alcohol dehydrogenase [Candidatus Sumerlaeia bacterium]HON49319.1 iron-containing alcohol dehydrogenase [Candidatus Sumerlaeota bacterium]HOR64933.1 iron-containing alcohol dehydrogenase [Candidatus Sumerlaeota bacterium]
MRFEFGTASRIIFGAGSMSEAAPLAAEMGRRVFLVTGKSSERAEPLFENLRAAGLAITHFNAIGEPTISLAQEGIGTARDAGCDIVIGIGGGSVLDTGKAIAALLANDGDAMDYLEVIGRGRILANPSAPFIAIPTTAGTGAEVTRNAVFSSSEHRIKISMRSPLMLPRLAIVDPLLTHSMPPDLTAHTGLDALTQLLEAFVSIKANPMTDGVCREGLTRAGRALRRAYEDGRDAAAREDMALASLFSGMALANAGLGAVHGFAAVLGGMYHTPHGAVCASLLPDAMEANIRALRERAPQSPALVRYEEAARLLTGSATASAEYGILWVKKLCGDLKIEPVSAYGIRAEEIPDIVRKARASSSMKGNPIALTDEEIESIIRTY